MLILLNLLSIQDYTKVLFKTNLSPLNRYKSQKTSRKTRKKDRFEKSLLGFFDLAVYLRSSQLSKTLNDLHQALEWETNLLNLN